MRTNHRIVIVENPAAQQASCRAWLEMQSGITVVRTVDCASGSFAVVSRERPDLFIINLDMPGHSILQLARDLRVLHPGLKILILSENDEELGSDHVMRAGAKGCLSKGSSHTLVSAVREILSGGLSFTPCQPATATRHEPELVPPNNHWWHGAVAV